MTDDYKRITIITLCAAAVLTTDPAVAKVVATCGESAGHAWYYDGALVPKSKSGWTADRISGGGFQIIRSSDDYDLVFTDATGGTKSSKGDGGVVIGENPEAGVYVLTIIYPGRLIEVYVLRAGVVTFSQAKFNSLINKHSLMKANCRY